MGVVVMSNIVDQVPATTEAEIVTKRSLDSTQSPSTETTLGDLAARIVADAKVSPIKYLRRCVTGHDGE